MADDNNNRFGTPSPSGGSDQGSSKSAQSYPFPNSPNQPSSQTTIKVEPPPSVSTPPSQPQPIINIQTPPAQAAPNIPSQPESPTIIPAVPTVKSPSSIGNINSIKEGLINKLGVLAGIVFGAIETTLGLRIIFKLLGANPSNMFISRLYQLTDAFVVPFVGIFNINLSFGGFALDIPSIIAILIYSIIGYGLLWLTRLL